VRQGAPVLPQSVLHSSARFNSIGAQPFMQIFVAVVEVLVHFHLKSQQCNPGGLPGIAQILVERSERQRQAQREFEVCGIVHGQPM
jgi:hypothetical protein